METEELTQITQEEAAPPESGVKPADAGQEQASTQPQRLSWEQILADPDYKSRYDASVQEIVQRRLRDRNRAEQTLQQLEPVLRALEEVCGVHPEDSEALCGRIYELGRGGAPDEGQLREHLARLMAEGERLKSRLPDFDLERDLENPDFLRLTAVWGWRTPSSPCTGTASPKARRGRAWPPSAAACAGSSCGPGRAAPDRRRSRRARATCPARSGKR